jgi:hypothetical protein
MGEVLGLANLRPTEGQSKREGEFRVRIVAHPQSQGTAIVNAV